MRKKYELLPSLFWMGLSIFAMTHSRRLELGTFQDPGPGLMPFLVGSALLVVSTIIFLKSFLKTKGRTKQEEAGAPSSTKIYKIGVVLGALLTYAFLLEKIGYLITTTALLIFLFRIAGSKQWKSILAASVFTVFLTFLVFTFLGLRFPIGILKGY
jgi:putative tricarboxylic transport membrane protein